LKLALLTYLPKDYLRSTSGVPKASFSLVKAIKKYYADIDIEIIVLDNTSENDETIETEFGPIHYLAVEKNSLIFLYIPEVKKVKKVLDRMNPDIVHSQGFPEYILAGEYSGYPHVATLHGIILKEAKTEIRPFKHFVRAIIRGIMEQFYIRKLKNIISISDYIGRYISKATDTNLFKIDNCIDEEFFDLKNIPIKGRILQVGSLVHRKGGHILVEAIALLDKNYFVPSIHFAGNMGDLNYLKTIKQLILEKGLEQYFHFHDSISDSELMDLYSTAEIICLASLEETSPISIAQAMAAGKIILASDCGGIPDLLKDGRNGFLFKSGSAKSLHDKLVEILNSKEKSLLFAQEAKKEAYLRFHPKNVALKTIEVYQSITAK